MAGWWRWALVSLDGVVPIRMVDVSASVNLPLHHKVQMFSSGTGSPGWSWKKGHKMVVVIMIIMTIISIFLSHRKVVTLEAVARQVKNASLKPR